VDTAALIVGSLPGGFGLMDADAHPGGEAVLQTVALEGPLDLEGATDGGFGPFERDEEAVADAVDLLAAVAGEEGAQGLVVPAQQVIPRLVTQHLHEIGGGDDVGEHERPAGPAGVDDPRRSGRLDVRVALLNAFPAQAHEITGGGGHLQCLGGRRCEANQEIVRRYQEAYNTNNLNLLDELLAPEWTTNGWPEGVPQSIEAAKDFYQAVLQSFPDLQFITLNLVAEGDWVVQRTLARGTFKGELAGLPPNGQVCEAGGISMFRIADGKIVEHWAYADDTGFWDQAGVEMPEILRAMRHRSPTSPID
jgi:steroid delta-isomerase-like uncharacterized protein